MDNVVINQFERALSSDINNLQKMSARMLADLGRWLGARRRTPVFALEAVTPDVGWSPDVWFLGMALERVNSTTYMVNAGVLAVESPGNITIGALDSNLVIAFQRAAVNRTMPLANPTRVVGEYYLVSARPVAIVTLNTVVEVFDVPTQTFVPQAKDKRVEYQVEYREDVGPQIPSLPQYGAFPALSAAPASSGWRPLGYLKVVPNTADPTHGQVTDLRRDLRDTLRSAPLDPVGNTEAPVFPAEVLVRRLESTGNPSDSANYQSGFQGFFRAMLQGKEYSLACPAGTVPSWFAFNELDTLVNGKITHFYLCPLRSGETAVVPSVSDTGVNGYALQRGVVAVCQDACPPNRFGTNSAEIKLPSSGAAGLWTAFDNIRVGEAVYICSSQNVSAITNVVPFAMAGGRHVYGFNLAAANDMSGPIVVIGQPITANAVAVHSLDLTNYVPRNARWVELGIEVVCAGSVGLTHLNVMIGKEDSKIGGAVALTPEKVLDTVTMNPGGPSGSSWFAKARVPLFTPLPNDPLDASVDAFLRLAIAFASTTLTGSTFGSQIANVYILGWDVGQ